MPEEREPGGVPAVIEAEVVHPLTQQFCTCCEPPKRLVKPMDQNVPFAFCFREGGLTTVYERQQEGGYLQTKLELRENSIIDPKTEQTVFPPAEEATVTVQESLLSEAPESSGGSSPQARTRISLRDEEYW